MTSLTPLKCIFDIEYGNQLDRNKLSLDDDGTHFISRSSQNLGIDCKVSAIEGLEPYPKGLITVSLGGTYLLSSFVQPEPFYTAQNIKVLRPKSDMSFRQKVFYCCAIARNRFRYTSHGREANKTLYNLLVPDDIPGWVGSIEIPEISGKPASLENRNLFESDWKWFRIAELFDVSGSKTTPLADLEERGEGEFPYITTQDTNNGVGGFYDYYTENKDGRGLLTVESAVIGYCTYQNRPFSASDHVEVLYPKFRMDSYIAMFLVTILNMEQFRYNYGRKCSQTRLKRLKIKLPSKEDSPDFEFMREFIRSLPYCRRILSDPLKIFRDEGNGDT